MENIAVTSAAGEVMQFKKKSENGSETPWFVLNSPELGKPFQALYQACEREGVLDKKTKELLMLVVASTVSCLGRVEKHIESAMEAGVSKEQITEALIIAAAEAASACLEMQKYIYLKHLHR